MMTNPTHEQFDPTHLLGGEYRVPRLGYGAMQLAGPGVIGLPEDVPGAIDVLRRAVDLGVRFFDTANAYGPRTVNQLIGRAQVEDALLDMRMRDNIHATEIADQLTDDVVQALTAVEDEGSATLGTMPAQMIDALQRRRRQAV